MVRLSCGGVDEGIPTELQRYAGEYHHTRQLAAAIIHGIAARIAAKNFRKWRRTLYGHCFNVVVKVVLQLVHLAQSSLVLRIAEYIVAQRVQSGATQH